MNTGNCQKCGNIKTDSNKFIKYGYCLKCWRLMTEQDKNNIIQKRVNLVEYINNKIKNSDKNLLLKHESRRQLTEIFSRICGYIRPINQWNNGKKEEFHDRVKFKQ